MPTRKPNSSAETELRNTVGKALGRIPSGVFVLTAREGERRLGMLASWVQQAAFDPPAVCLAVGKDRPILPVIQSTRRLGLCVLGDGDTPLMRRFARAGTPPDNAFDGLEVIPAPSGLPIIANALAWLDAELLDCVDFAGDHVLLIARVCAGEMLRAGHSFTHVRGNGFHY
jgi:3-hydroxy-9,10-secoandrosta-1,3,5(10)-triene-9,17-dione monooxygenase reductase component